MNEQELLKEFRNVVISYSDSLKVVRNNIQRLLGKSQNYWSGIYRESLVKEVLRKLLPDGVSIDTGFIYGYGNHDQNSNQLDIIIWNSGRHSPVYRTKDFVVVSAESVITVISVKSNINDNEIIHGLENLCSIIPLDLFYRDNFSKYFKESEECKPISKYLLFLDEDDIDDDKKIEFGKTISDFYTNLINGNQKYKNFLTTIIKETDFYACSNEPIENKINREKFKLIYPKHIFCATTNSFSYYIGFGENPTKNKEFQWIPTVYTQNSNRTTPFEKFMYYLMQDIYVSLGTIGIPFLSAMGNIDPRLGWDNKDVSEIDEASKLPLINI